jgi:general secretion pathway protein I
MALAVLAVALAALVTAAGNNARNAVYLKEKTLAHWIAMNKAAEWRLSNQWPGIGTQSGNEVMADQEWRWEITTFETPDETVKRIEIAVFPDNPEVEEPTVRRIAYLGKP